MNNQATHTATRFGYDEAAREIAAGRARGHALWVLLSDEHDRDGYGLKPSPWEGAGQYQRVTFDDGRDVFVFQPFGSKSLPTDWPKAPKVDGLPTFFEYHAERGRSEAERKAALEARNRTHSSRAGERWTYTHEDDGRRAGYRVVRAAPTAEAVFHG